MIYHPFWKVFFKKQNLGIIHLPINVQKTIKRSKVTYTTVKLVYDYTTVKLVQQLQIVFRLVLCIAHRCDCNKRNNDPVCTYCIRCKHTNDRRIPGFDCNQVAHRRSKCLLGLVDLGSTMDKGIDWTSRCLYLATSGFWASKYYDQCNRPT